MNQSLVFLTIMAFVFFACNSKVDSANTFENDEKSMKELKIVRPFDVEPEKVFKAFTSPSDMLVWWTPDTQFDIDLQVGGRYTITRKEGETTLVMTGTYLEVEQPYKLKYTCAMPQFSAIVDTITIEIQASGNGGSQLTFIQQGEGIDEELQQLAEEAVSASEKGWRLGFDLMEKNWKNTKN